MIGTYIYGNKNSEHIDDSPLYAIKKILLLHKRAMINIEITMEEKSILIKGQRDFEGGEVI